MGERTVELEVLRYHPEKDEAPRLQRYSVGCREEWVVLDALNHIKETIDPTLSYRWSCHMAVCGSCGMMINGEPKLACKAFLRNYAGVIRVEPLAHFPIERDLVTVIDDFMDKLKRVRPYLMPKERKALADGEYLQTPAELNKFKQYSMCINCMLCYAACPIYGLDPKFIGPAAIALAQRYNLDGRDQGAPERLQILSEHEGIWGCTFVGECTKVCPKHVDPAGAIQRYKLDASVEWLKSFFMPRGA